MSAHHDHSRHGHSHDHSGHSHDHGDPHNPAYRRVLWIALVLNAAMFIIEIASGVKAGSVSLLADAIDFFGDAANYGLTIAVLSMGVLWRSRAALVKAASMGLFGVAVLAKVAWSVIHGVPPEALTMGVVGVLALLTNLGVAGLLYAWREGDANMRSVWLCTRNDAIGNVAVMGAALGVFGTGSAWPDLLVASGMAALALWSAWAVLHQARGEMARPKR
ncbi:MAG: cation transporter [Pseudomonadota bacterium]